MFTENGVVIDLEEVGKVVDTCDVFTIGFRLFPERVIVDTREGESEGPMVEIVEPVTSVEERFHWLGRRRPELGVPEQFSFFVWPHSMEFFEGSGVVQRILDRIGAADRPELAGAMKDVLAKLRALERKSAQQALAGEGYHTLWSLD